MAVDTGMVFSIVEDLTRRELQVLKQVATGARNREVATSMGVSVKAVEFHMTNILGKLGARSRTEAILRAWRVGLVRLERSEAAVD